MRLGFSFRVLANLEHKFIRYLNRHYGTQLRFRKIKTSDFAFAYGLSEEVYIFELNKFLSHELKKVTPVIGACQAVRVLRKYHSDICIISSLDVMHHANLAHWIAENYDGWRPRIYHTDSMGNSNRNPHWTEKEDVCFTTQLEVFVTENPVDAQRVAVLLLEQEVLLLRMPWNEQAEPMHTHKLGSWSKVLRKINALEKGV